MSHGSITVSHNMEVAHRLSLLPGKCQNIHGHSMQVTMTISGLPLNANGIAGGVDFGTLKKSFRSIIDGHYDHKLHLNKDDDFAGPHFQIGKRDEKGQFTEDFDQVTLPGLVIWTGDPTVENLAKWICEDMIPIVKQQASFGMSADLETLLADDLVTITVDIQETMTNGASWTEVIE